MRHREAIDYLPDLGSGLLEPETQAEVSGHVEHCPACRDWLATHDLLLDALFQGRPTDDGHPESDMLALCVVRPEELLEPGRERLRAHLERCSECRSSVSSLRNALRQARPRQERSQLSVILRAPKPWHRSKPLAANLTILVLCGGMLFGALVLTRLTSAPSTPVHDSVAQGLLFSDAANEIAGQDFEGRHVIQAESPLMVSKLTVKTGAHVTLRATGGVAFGDGFQVASGGRLVVGSDAAHSEALTSADDSRINPSGDVR